MHGPLRLRSCRRRAGAGARRHVHLIVPGATLARRSGGSDAAHRRPRARRLCVSIEHGTHAVCASARCGCCAAPDGSAPRSTRHQHGAPSTQHLACFIHVFRESRTASRGGAEAPSTGRRPLRKRLPCGASPGPRFARAASREAANTSRHCRSACLYSQLA
jgi:hypothetical protein